MPESEWYTAKDKKRYAYGSLFKQYIYGGRRLMAGRQIVTLKMRVRFSSITPASSRRARSRVSLFAEREKPLRIQHC